jgi:hypothetical protein
MTAHVKNARLLEYAGRLRDAAGLIANAKGPGCVKL